MRTNRATAIAATTIIITEDPREKEVEVEVGAERIATEGVQVLHLLLLLVHLLLEIEDTEVEVEAGVEKELR